MIDKYYDIDLPQSIIDSFARFLVPQIREYYLLEEYGEEKEEQDQEIDQ